MGASRSRVIATLREYLHVEYKVKHKGATRDFTKNCVKGTVPKVPQQTNFTDCGLYVLQYVEEFFRVTFFMFFFNQLQNTILNIKLSIV